jgi:hypothetical protein
VKHLEQAQQKQPKYREPQPLAEADLQEEAHRQVAQPQERSSFPSCR